MLVSWVLFPAVLAALSCGCGLLVEHVAGFRLPGTLLLPLGFSVIVVASLLVTTSSATARLATPVVITLSIAGLGLSWPWRHRTFDRWAGGAAVGVFAVFGAPVLFSGQATFLGYIKLDDTANWFGLTDRLIEHGRTVAGLAPSTYQATLNYYLNQYGYPVATFPPLGIGHSLVGTDPAWLIQPYQAFLAAMLALGLYGLLTSLIESQGLRALVVFVAAQPALLYGYSLWGGVKEIATSAMLVLVAVLAPSALREQASARNLLPLATASAALFGILNLGSAVWLGPLLLPLLVAGIGLRGRAFVTLAAAFTALAVALSVPSLLIAGSFTNVLSLNGKGGEVGNLFHPLSWLQVFGIWPVGDFRLRPGDMRATYVLIGLLIAAAVAGIVWAVRRRVWELPLFVGAALAGCYVASRGGSTWIDAKALAIASPALVLAGMAGVAWLFQSGRLVEGVLVAAAIAGGVGWSNALAYHSVWLAPRGQLAEQEKIGKRFAGEGPTLLTEYEFYGARHFLRKMDPEGAAAGLLDPYPVPLRNGQFAGGYADIDEFQLDGILRYRSLVLGRSPAASRPPSVYHLAWRGRFYEVWQRPPSSGGKRILEHLSLGQGDQAAAVPSCRDVLRLAREATRAGGVLATVLRAPATVLPLARASHPAGWTMYSGSPDPLYFWSGEIGSPDIVYPHGAGTLNATVRVPAAGRYGVWIGGSFRRRLEVRLDGRRIGEARYQLNTPGVYTQLGVVELRGGTYEVELRSGAADFRPGSDGPPFPLGPLVLSRETDALPVTYVQPTDARSLCGKSLDWVEAVRG